MTLVINPWPVADRRQDRVGGRLANFQRSWCNHRYYPTSLTRSTDTVQPTEGIDLPARWGPKQTGRVGTVISAMNATTVC
jgi:hypothetical protein